MINVLSDNRVTLNVGGVKHEVLWRTLDKLPDSRLGKIRNAKRIEELRQLCDDVDVDKNELFFDRHSASFAAVLNYYRTGKLHLVEDLCVLSFRDDLAYWGIDESYLESCCHLKYHQKIEAIMEEIRKEEEAEKEKVTSEKFVGCFPKVRKKVWDLMENPQTSTAARVILLLILNS
jgi:potassium voltage-gated channel Shab-related subfamily B member 1